MNRLTRRKFLKGITAAGFAVLVFTTSARPQVGNLFSGANYGPQVLMGFPAESSVTKNWVLMGVSLSGQGTLGAAYPSLLTTDNYPINAATLTGNISLVVPHPFDLLPTDVCVAKVVNVGGAAGGDIQLSRGADAQFTGSISGTTLTVASMDSGKILIGAVLDAATIAANTVVTGFLTGIGGAGTYTVSNSQTVTSRTIFVDGFLNVTVTSGSLVGGTAFNLTLKGTNPRVEFTLPLAAEHKNITFNFVAGGTFSGCSKLVICKKSDEADATNPATPEAMIYAPYAAQYTPMKNKIQRPMGMTNPNFSNRSRASHRVAWQTGLTFSARQWVPSAWVGTISGTDTYTCSAAPSGGALVDGYLIQGQFQNDNTIVAATLDYNGTGAIPLRDGAGRPLVIGDVISGQNPTGLVSLIYDSISFGGTPCWLLTYDGLIASYPVEATVALANVCGTDYWHCFHAMYDNASCLTEANVAASQLTIGRNFLSELANELWNPGFTALGWFSSRGLGSGFPSDNNRQYLSYASLRIQQIMSTIAPAFASRGGFKPVCAHQAVILTAVKTYLFDGADLVNNKVHATQCTISIASPAVINGGGLGFMPSPGYAIVFTTTGALPTGITAGVTYYASAAGATSTTYRIAATKADAIAGINSINTAGTQSGVHTMTYTNTLYALGDHSTAPNRCTDAVVATSFAPYTVGANILQVQSDYINANGSGYNFTALLAAADAFDSGDRTTGLNYVDNDVRAGTRSDGSQPGGTLFAFAKSGGLYDFYNGVAGGYSPPKELHCYEGAPAAIIAPTTVTCTALGINTLYGCAFFTGYIIGTQLVVTLVIGGSDLGAILDGTQLVGNGVVDGTTIVSQASGTTGGVGIYNLSGGAQVVSPGPMSTGKISRMIYQYKFDTRHRLETLDWITQFKAYSQARTQAILQLGSQTANNPWGLLTGDLGSAPYQSYNAVVAADGG